jgi:outer membrane protein
MQMYHLQKIRLVLISITFLLASATVGQERPTSSTSVAIGLVYRNRIYKKDDAMVMPIPMVYYESKDFFFKGRSLGYHVLKSERFSFDVIGQWRFDGYDDIDSSFLRGMDDREMTLDGGFELSYKDGWGKTSITFVSDLLGRHDGQELSISYGKQFTAGKWMLTPAAGVIWNSHNLADYYSGVRPNEAQALRPAYSVGEAWNPTMRLNMLYPINKQWSAMGLIRYQWLDNEITDSPIVDADYQIQFMAGLLYQF